jgi:hypothetical protein
MKKTFIDKKMEEFTRFEPYFFSRKGAGDVKDFIRQAVTEAVESLRVEEKKIPKGIKVNNEMFIDVIKAFMVKDQGFNRCAKKVNRKIDKLIK